MTLTRRAASRALPGWQPARSGPVPFTLAASFAAISCCDDDVPQHTENPEKASQTSVQHRCSFKVTSCSHRYVKGGENVTHVVNTSFDCGYAAACGNGDRWVRNKLKCNVANTRRCLGVGGRQFASSLTRTATQDGGKTVGTYASGYRSTA